MSWGLQWDHEKTWGKEVKLIFLDIDGVLHTKHTMHGTESMFSPSAVAYLNDILSATQARIVISSSWRLMMLEDLVQVLATNGINTRSIIGITPVVPYNGYGEDMTRAQEILLYLKECEFPVESWVALDDDPAILDLPEHNRVYIENGWDEAGLQSDHAVEAMRKLFIKANPAPPPRLP